MFKGVSLLAVLLAATGSHPSQAAQGTLPSALLGAWGVEGKCENDALVDIIVISNEGIQPYEGFYQFEDIRKMSDGVFETSFTYEHLETYRRGVQYICVKDGGKRIEIAPQLGYLTEQTPRQYVCEFVSEYTRCDTAYQRQGT